LLLNDDFYTKLIIRDGKGIMSMTIEDISKTKKVIKNQDISNAIEVPFAVIENVPIYPGCESLLTNAERRRCMSDSINKNIQKSFNTDLAADLGLKGRQRINVIFKIDENGNIIAIRSRAAHPRLEKEAIRVIGLLPKMIPGTQSGENVIVPYSLPIIFQVADKKD